MPSVQANGITIEYRIDGEGPPLLLVMGLAGQLTDWSEPLVEALAQSFSVIRYDNRDAGLSTEVTAPAPTRLTFIKAYLRGKSVDAAYRLDDLADDGAALLQALGIERAHVVGMSMGGMVAQLIALRHPNRVASLCSIMSTTGSRRVGQPSPRVLFKLATADDDPTLNEAFDESMALLSIIGGADWDADAHARQTRASMARSFRPEGVLRQSLAVALATDRTERLKAITVPTLVIHGLDDKLVRPSGGVATANAIGHAQLLMLPRMGHYIPATRASQIAEAIVENASVAISPEMAAG